MDSWPHQNSVDAFYGNPRGMGDDPNEHWVSTNIVRLPPPWKIVTAWDFQPVNAIRVHRRCAESLDRVLKRIWSEAEGQQSKINEWGMQLYAGGFNYRPMKTSTRLSMHSWGCAVDFDSARNSLGDRTPNFATIPEVLTAFKMEGWTWGGHWSTPDGMHWQAAEV